MAIAAEKPLSNAEMETHLREHGITVPAEQFIKECRVPERIIRTRTYFFQILAADARVVLAHEDAEAMLRERNLPITLGEYLAACAVHGRSEAEALQRLFFMRFLKKYNPRKRLQDQSVIVKKKTAFVAG